MTIIYRYLLIVFSLFTFHLNEENKEEILQKKDHILDNGFERSLFFEYANGIGSTRSMSYKFESLSPSKSKFVYKFNLPVYIKQEDTLTFIVDFKQPENSIFIRKDFYINYQKYIPAEEKYDRKIEYKEETFPMVYMDSINVFFEGELFPVYKFRSFTGDFLCHTFYVNKQLGVFKRYGPHDNDCVEHLLIKGEKNYYLLNYVLDVLDNEEDFHDNCDGSETWVSGDKFPNERKARKKEKRN